MSARKTSRGKLWIGRFIIFLFYVVLLELVLRGIGYQPGFYGDSVRDYISFKPVDTLILDRFFYTDSEAITKANYTEQELFDYDSTIQINSDGFRDHEFELVDRDKTTVLLIGDSFCWGGSARPLDHSFADLLEDFDYEVYNTGIPGTGPAQYLLVAQKFVPRLKPDKVVVVFYMANDVMYRDIPAKPNASNYHLTNAGWLDAYIDGDYLATPQECYEYFLKRFSIPELESHFNRLMSKSVITTQIWSVFARIGWVAHRDHPDVTSRKATNPYPVLKEPVSYKYLKAIKELCKRNETEFYLCIVPVHTNLEDDPKVNRSTIFHELKYHWPVSLRYSDYNDWPDGHLNNNGHMKYAKFLDEVLRSPH
jgi:hypothetical protein